MPRTSRLEIRIDLMIYHSAVSTFLNSQRDRDNTLYMVFEGMPMFNIHFALCVFFMGGRSAMASRFIGVLIFVRGKSAKSSFSFFLFFLYVG